MVFVGNAKVLYNEFGKLLIQYNDEKDYFIIMLIDGNKVLSMPLKRYDLEELLKTIIEILGDKP